MAKKKKQGTVHISEILRPLTNALKKGYEESGKSIVEYAPDVGLSHVTFLRIQKGQLNNISLTKMISVANLAGLDVAILFKQNQSKK